MSAAATPVADERTWRPRNLEEFVGQSGLKATLGLMLQSAQTRGTALEHVAFYGGPGLGKTTLAYVIANTMGGALRELSAPAIAKPGDLASVLTSLSEGGVLFLDEIHGLKRAIAEILYSAMEDFKVSIQMETGSDPIVLALKRFTLVGATTDYGLLPQPLRARFGHIFALDLYTREELEQVVARAAFLQEVLIDRESLAMIASRARGTPRLALRLFRRCYDLAVVRANDLTSDLTAEALTMLKIDAMGLDQTDRRYLATMVQVYEGGPVGLKALATSAGINPVTVEHSVEPWLLRAGLIARTRRGRKITMLCTPLARRGITHVAAFLHASA